MQSAKKAQGCQARQYGDQMICGACGLQWDTNDPEPPQCGPVKIKTLRRGSNADSVRNCGGGSPAGAGRAL